MEKLNDRIHNCEKCEIYPCSLQEEVSSSDICIDCLVSCCRNVLVPLLPCEENKLGFGLLKMKDNGWCCYYDEKKETCTIYDIRPIACRVHSCRFIRDGKIPDDVKNIKKKMWKFKQRQT